MASSTLGPGHSQMAGSPYSSGVGASNRSSTKQGNLFSSGVKTRQKGGVSPASLPRSRQSSRFRLGARGALLLA